MFYVYDIGSTDEPYWGVFVVKADSLSGAAIRLGEVRQIVADLKADATVSASGQDEDQFAIDLWHNDEGERVTLHIQCGNLAKVSASFGEAYEADDPRLANL